MTSPRYDYLAKLYLIFQARDVPEKGKQNKNS